MSFQPLCATEYVSQGRVVSHGAEVIRLDGYPALEGQKNSCVSTLEKGSCAVFKMKVLLQRNTSKMDVGTDKLAPTQRMESNCS